MTVMRRAPTHIAVGISLVKDWTGIYKYKKGDIQVKVAPTCSMLKPWFFSKMSGTEPNWRYRTAQLKETQREKKKTTGSVTSISIYISTWPYITGEGGGHTERSIQRNANHLRQRRALLITLDLPPNTPRVRVLAHQDAKVACCLELVVVLVQGMRLAAQKHAASGLLEEEEDNNDKHAGHDRMRPVHPAPRCMVHDDARNQRCQARTKQRSAGKERHGCIPVFSVVDIANDTTDHGRECRSPNTLKEPSNKEACKDPRASTGNNTSNEQNPTRDKNRTPPINL